MGDGRLHLLLDHPDTETLSCIAAVGNQTVKDQAVYHLNRLADVRLLSGRQSQAQGIAQTSDYVLIAFPQSQIQPSF